MGKPIIREGDTTSHGGTVLEAFPKFSVYGKNAAGVGHRGYCPQCKRDFVIVAGAANYTFMGKNVAVEGMLTSCGAVLIASQGQATVDNTPGATASAGSTFGSAAIAAAGTAAELMFNDKYVIKGHDGIPLANTEYALSVDGGEPEHGVTDASGHTHLLISVAEQHHIDIYLEG